MREIKFRGKIDKSNKHYNEFLTNVWSYGYYMHNDCYGDMPHAIFDIDRKLFLPVIPETVGQFTGVQDKNGKDIYVGDIIQTLTEVF